MKPGLYPLEFDNSVNGKEDDISFLPTGFKINFHMISAPEN